MSVADDELHDTLAALTRAVTTTCDEHHVLCGNVTRLERRLDELTRVIDMQNARLGGKSTIVIAICSVCRKQYIVRDGVSRVQCPACEAMERP